MKKTLPFVLNLFTLFHLTFFLGRSQTFCGAYRVSRLSLNLGGAKQHPAILGNHLSSVWMAAGRFETKLEASWGPAWEEVEVKLS